MTKVAAKRTKRLARRRSGRPTAEESQVKLDELMAVAREQFIALGYRAVTMRGMAAAARVSTRTLYNRYTDKLGLFEACLDFGAKTFPHIEAVPGIDLKHALQRHAADIVRSLSADAALHLSMLVFREGGEFPELLRASEANYDRHLVQPLATFLRASELGTPATDEIARLFIVMALSEWERCVTYRHPLPRGAQVDRYAALVAQVFVDGLRSSQRGTSS